MTQAEANRSFRRDLGRLVLRLGTNSDLAARGMAERMAENVIVGGKYADGTPVDTGNARGSWYPAMNGVPAASAPTGIVSALQSLDRAVAVYRNGKAGATFELWTNVVYMPALEYGHSKQAPRGMVRLTLRAGQMIAEDVARELPRG